MVDSSTNKQTKDGSSLGRRLHLREVAGEYADYDNYDGIGAELKAARNRSGQSLRDLARV